MKLIKEDITSYLKPKSEEELNNIISNMDFEDYYERVEKILDDKLYDLCEIDADLSSYNIKKFYDNRISPLNCANEIIKDYFKNNWNPEYFVIKNNKRIEINIKNLDTSADYIQYKYPKQIIPFISAVEYYLSDLDNPFFIDKLGNEHYLSDFIQIKKEG